ncbi:Na+/solute symporter [Hippea maritima DSM 10411]|uniref:Na+/solute symporter n=2 Tax=Hippea TaxID=84404 RepID=F2LTL6_HIPMA|nr:Na+/solute symporter [Hippea maritima DSM 10411]
MFIHFEKTISHIWIIFFSFILLSNFILSFIFIFTFILLISKIHLPEKGASMQILFIVTLILFSGFLLVSHKNVKSEKEFTVAGRGLSASGVSFVIIGTLVGGASTIGTVQLAYTFGLAAWIFTLFSGIACLVLGLFFSKLLREEEVITVSELIGNRFGNKVQKYSSFLGSFGVYIHIVAQFLAAMSIIQTVFSFGRFTSMFAVFVLILIFVVSGGIVSSSYVGRIKVYLLYSLMLLGAFIALLKQHGLVSLIELIPNKNMLSLFSYGKSKAIGDMFSMVIGVLSTQTYLQAIFSAKDVKTAKKGAFLSAALIPPIGIFGIIIGIYMRIHYPELAHNTTLVFPYFIKTYFHPIIAAIFMAGLTIIIVGTASGLTLGVTTNMYIDILKDGLLKRFKVKEVLKLKLIAFIVLASSMAIVLLGLDSRILDWSYLSMGIRGSAVFVPLFMILLIKDKNLLSKLSFIVWLSPVAYLIIALITRH